MTSTSRQWKGVVVVSDDQLPHVDHLLPLAHLLQLPCYFLSTGEWEKCQLIYPEVEMKLVDYRLFTAEYLIDQFDVLFVSQFWAQNNPVFDLFEGLEQQKGRQVKKVYAPHGFSDKADCLVKCAEESFCLIYGQNMVDMIREGAGRLPPHHALVGNYRKAYYEKFQSHFDQVARQAVGEHFAAKTRMTVLYAPTWTTPEEADSFFHSAEILLETFPEEWNLIFKPHPRMESLPVNSQEEPSFLRYQQLMGQFMQRENILFLELFAPIYPLLQLVDLYVGDSSSVGYDFLAFDRPLYFLNRQRLNVESDRRAQLFSCGRAIPPEEIVFFWERVRQTLEASSIGLAPERQRMYRYTFGEPLSLEETASRIEAMVEL